MAFDALGRTSAASGRFAEAELLGEVLTGREVLRAGASGTPVQILQEALRDMGFPMMVLRGDLGVSGVDGSFGTQTEIALRNFQVHAAQSYNDVMANAVLDAATMRALFELCPAPGNKAWHVGQPNHAPVACWDGDQSKRLRVVVVKNEHRTFLYDNEGNCSGIFPNAHGTAANRTDPGLKVVASKLDQIDAKATGKGLWKNERAFGKRIINLSWATGKSHGEELHGTYDYANMGKDVSHGCVRHYNEDIISIFDAVRVGDLVAIVDSVKDQRLRN